jgi:hypothetical protein
MRFWPLVFAMVTRGARMIQASTPLAVWWWEKFLNLTASLVTQTTHMLVEISKETGGSRGLQVTLHQFFGLHTNSFLSHCYVSCIFMQHCVKTSLGPVTDLIVARDRCRHTQPATEWLARTILSLICALLAEIRSSLL